MKPALTAAPSRAHRSLALSPGESDAAAVASNADDACWLARREDLVPFDDATGPASPADHGTWALAEALFVTESGLPPASRLAWMCADLRDFMTQAGSRARWTFRLALWFTSWCAPLFVGRMPPLARLPVHDRVEALERFERGGLAQTAAVLALKAVLCILYYEHPDAAASIDFDASCKGPPA